MPSTKDAFSPHDPATIIEVAMWTMCPHGQVLPGQHVNSNSASFGSRGWPGCDRLVVPPSSKDSRMNVLKFVPRFAALAVGVAVAERVPVLSEPLSIPVRGATTVLGWSRAWMATTTQMVGNDSVLVAGEDWIGATVRAPDSLARLNVQTDSVTNSVNPTLIRIGDRSGMLVTPLLVGDDRASTIGVPNWIASIFVSRIDSGIGLESGPFLGGDFQLKVPFRSDSTVTQQRLLCGRRKVIHVRQDYSATSDPQRWISDSIVSPVQGRPVCDLDPLRDDAAIAWPEAQGRYSVKSDTAPFVMSSPVQTVLSTDTLTWIVAGRSGGWCAFNHRRSVFYVAMKKAGGIHLDSIVDQNLPKSGVAGFRAAHSDSLLVFGVDSLLVFAKWTVSGFQIVSKVSIPGEAIVDVSFAPRDSAFMGAPYRAVKEDGIVWALTATKLYSFKLDWKERPSAAIRGSEAIGAALRLTNAGGAVRFEWDGGSRTPLQIADAKGRVFLESFLEPHRPFQWRGQVPGVYFANICGESRPFVVR